MYDRERGWVPFHVGTLHSSSSTKSYMLPALPSRSLDSITSFDLPTSRPRVMNMLRPKMADLCRSALLRPYFQYGLALVGGQQRNWCGYAVSSRQEPVTETQTLRRAQLVPDAPPPSLHQLERLYDFVVGSKRLVVLTGAGVSTESGIPDYRSPNGAYSTGFKPITHQEFVRSAASRRRYWARSYAGWYRFVAAKPGATHLALSQLETRGHLTGLITQNVDRLHHRAGSDPIELHGTTHNVVCLGCGNLISRAAFQERLKLLNTEWCLALELVMAGEPGSDASFGMKQRPDGDVEIGDEFVQKENFLIPACENCGGILKPDVVLFGDNVPLARVEAASSMVKGADAVLVVGSSLMVLSAFRLARAAHEGGAPIAVVNIGPTRADDFVTLKVESRSGEILPRLLSMGALNIPASK